jgi:hypothetical protein
VTTYASRDRPAHRRVDWRIALGVVAAALVVAAAADVVFTRTADATSPLGPSNGWGPDGGSPLFYRSLNLPFGDAKTNFVLGFKPHSEFRFGFAITNRGDAPLRIDGVVPPSEECCSMGRIGHVLMQHAPNRYTLAGATEKPLTIQPGRDGYLIPVYETGGPCRPHWSPNSAESFDRIHLRYTYRGARHTEWYEMPVVVGIVCGSPKAYIHPNG